MSPMKKAALAAVVLVPLTGALLALAASPADDSIERGRYLARIAGCNDCHTPGYAERAGNVPESEWLVGTALGWRGDWGTTYAANLRLYMQRLTEDQWMTVARDTQLRPPMPWFALRDMTDADLRAIYRYVRHLGPAGELMPAYVPPDGKPSGPVVDFPRAGH